MQIVDCDYDTHASEILEIFNHAILNTTAFWEYETRLPESMVGWFEEKSKRNYPVVGAVSDDGRLMGFASYGTFRDRRGYKYTIENSVYVHQDFRGQGVAQAVMQRLIEIAEQQEYHLMIAGIDRTNTASIALHTKLGFAHSATIPQAGFKFGRWLDLLFYHLILPTPLKPEDD